MPLAHPAGGGELVGVAGDTDVGELVDVVEDQLGKAAELSGGEAGLDGGGAEVVPGGAGADPIGGGQRVHRPTAARLAAAQGIGGLEDRLHIGRTSGRERGGQYGELPGV